MKNILKKIAQVTLISAAMGLGSSCSDYLDVSKEVAENLTLDKVFSTPSYTKNWHNGLFNCITEYSSTGGNQDNGFSGLWCFMSGETVVSAGPVIGVMTSGFTASTARWHRWQKLYQEIRDAMIFIDRVQPLGNYTDQEYLSVEQVTRMKTEAQFLIAYSYFSLFELYGPVPILDKTADPEAKDLDYARPPIDEFLSEVDKMLEDVINSGNLPETLITKPNNTGDSRYNLNEIVRPTKTAALALRAKLWVYAASPLFNGKYPEALEVVNKDGSKVFSPYNAEKWQTAKARLEDLFANTDQHGHKLYTINKADGTIDADRSIYELYQYYNDEILWATGVNLYNTSTMEYNTNPRQLYGGWAHVGLSQETVDAYFMKSGLSIKDPGTEYKEDGFASVENPRNENKKVDANVYNMYANREPRFYLGVLFEGQSWHIQPPGQDNFRIGFAKGEPSDNSQGDSPRCGYLLGKFKNRSLLPAGDYPTQWARPSILLRLADFYLYYAEVLNEINPSDSKIIEYIDKVRQRAGIPGYAELKTSGKKNIVGDHDLQLKAIQQERQVEFFAEGQRYFDIRRWMICGPDEMADQRYVHGLNMNGYSDFNQPIGTNANSYYTRTLVEDRAWKRAMYLYPIPDDEVRKSKLLVQNPLW